MKKGFTLIELLAVIVILAIIALIATPIVLGIINDSKNSAILRSAEFYVDAVKNAVMKKNLELQVPIDPKRCKVIDKYKVNCDEVDIEVEIDGEAPDSGYIIFDKGKTINMWLVFGNKKAVMNEKSEVLLADSEPCKLIDGVANEIGSKYECEVKKGTKYNFYVLSHEDDGTTNLIMERNICEDGSLVTAANKCYMPWINQSDYEAAGGVNWSDKSDINQFGPITATNYLNNATSSWSNISNLYIKYSDDGGNFTDFEITGKARMPFNSEFTAIGCVDYQDLTCPVWVADYLHNVGPDYGTTYQENPLDRVYGYWTLSTHPASTKVAWHMSYDGCSHYNDVDNGGSRGVRAVINIKL